MNGVELLNENFSKKMGLTLTGILGLLKAGAPSWQIMLVIISYQLIQGFLDRKPKEIKEKNNVQKTNSTDNTASTDIVHPSPG